jgi:uncharacterized protein (DUF2141 family)
VRHRSRHFGALTLCASAALLGGAVEVADVSVTVHGLRSDKGQVLACMTTRPAAFPDCAGDPQARSAKLPATESVEIDFGAVPAGRYAIALFHDENGNGRLDTRLMMPREGYGFSRDAPVQFGPPAFARAAFVVSSDDSHQAIRMRYIF